jgi:hypothetical protein
MNTGKIALMTEDAITQHIIDMLAGATFRSPTTTPSSSTTGTTSFLSPRS